MPKTFIITNSPLHAIAEGANKREFGEGNERPKSVTLRGQLVSDSGQSKTESYYNLFVPGGQPLHLVLGWASPGDVLTFDAALVERQPKTEDGDVYYVPSNGSKAAFGRYDREPQVEEVAA